MADIDSNTRFLHPRWALFDNRLGVGNLPNPHVSPFQCGSRCRTGVEAMSCMPNKDLASVTSLSTS